MLGLDSLLNALQQGVQAINGLTQQIKSTFPQVSALSSTATVGGLTFSSSQPAAFQTIVSSSGATYKVPLFNP